MDDFKVADELCDLVEKELKKIAQKSDLTPVEVKNATDAMCLLEKIEIVKAMKQGIYERPEENYSMRYAPRYSSKSYRSYDRGYSGHSIHDRMISCLEGMMDQANSDYEKNEIRRWIGVLENNR